MEFAIFNWGLVGGEKQRGTSQKSTAVRMFGESDRNCPSFLRTLKPEGGGVTRRSPNETGGENHKAVNNRQVLPTLKASLNEIIQIWHKNHQAVIVKTADNLEASVQLIFRG